MGDLIRLSEHGLAQPGRAQPGIAPSGLAPPEIAGRRRPGWPPRPHRFAHGGASFAPEDAAPDRPIDLDAARRRRRLRQDDPAVVHVRFGPEDPGTACGTFELECRPRIIGRQNAGTWLSVETGSWVPEPERFRYRWYSDGRPIHRATGPRYRVEAADRGARLSVRITAIRGGFAPRTASVTVH